MAEGDVGEDRGKEKPFPGLLVTRLPGCQSLSHVSTSRGMMTLV